MSGQAERYGTEVPLHDWAARPNLLCLRLLAASSIHHYAGKPAGRGLTRWAAALCSLSG